MSELISGKEAKLAWASGKKLQIMNMDVGGDFYDMDDSETTLNIFDLNFYRFRLKPRTININGIELEKPKAIEKPTVTSILLCFNGESERNVFLNTLMNRNF